MNLAPLCALCALTLSSAVLADGETRPTTPQEKAYSVRVVKALRASIDGIVASSDWGLIYDGPIAAEQGVSPGQEERPYAVGYNAPLTVKPDSARGQKLKKSIDALTAAAAEQMKAGKALEADYEARMNLLDAEQQPVVELKVNQRSSTFTLLDSGSKWQKVAVPGTKYALRATQTTAAEGNEATYLYLGSFAEPRQREDSTVAADGGLKAGAANELIVQNVLVRVQAPDEVADELIRKLDLQSLNALIGR